MTNFKVVMRVLVFILVITITSLNQLSGQNWNVFASSSDTLSMIDSAGTIWSAFADSVRQGAAIRTSYLHDRVGAPPSDTAMSNPGCQLYGASSTHIGKVIIEYPDSLLFCFVDDTVRFYNHDTVNDIYHTIGYSAYLEKTTLDTLFSGQLDSVKHFRVDVYAPQWLAGNYDMRLSKSNGLLAFPHIFDQVPYYYYLLHGPVSQLNRTDYSLLKTDEVFDFQPGDQFHYEYSYRVHIGPTNTKIINWTILSRQETNDSIAYAISRYIENKAYQYVSNPMPQQIVTTTYLQDTILLDYPKNIILGEGLSLQANSFGQSGMYSTNGSNREYVLFDVGGYWGGSKCISQGISFNPANYYYREGLGQTSYFISRYCGNGMNTCEFEERMLVYANRGGIIFGSPSFVSVSEFEEKRDIRVFPNPTKGVLHLSGVNPGSTYLLKDLTGRTIAKGVLLDVPQIDMSKLASGIYLLQVNRKVIRIIKES